MTWIDFLILFAIGCFCCIVSAIVSYKAVAVCYPYQNEDDAAELEMSDNWIQMQEMTRLMTVEQVDEETQV